MKMYAMSYQMTLPGEWTNMFGERAVRFEDGTIVCYPPPLFVMSPGVKVYEAKRIKRFKLDPEMTTRNEWFTAVVGEEE